MNASLFIDSIRKTICNKPSYAIITYAICVILLFHGFIKTEPLVFFSPTSSIPYSTYTDSVDGGSSIIEKPFIKNGLNVRYTLRSGFMNPYIGIVFKNNEEIFDVSKYNKLHIEVSTEKDIENLFVFITTKDKNVINDKQRLSDRYSNLLISTKGDRKVFDLPLLDFTTPIWWYEVVNQTPEDFGPIEFDKLKTVSITSGVTSKVDTPQSFSIKSIYFYTDYSSFFTYAITIFCVLLLFMGIYYFIKSYKKRKKIEIQYKPIESTNREENYFLTYINENYHDAELGLSEVAKKCSVNERTVSKIISEQFDCNFKTYLNQIRVAESQRLLKSTNLNISEISYKVGFNSPSHFTKVFNKLSGESPTSYLAKNKK